MEFEKILHECINLNHLNLSIFGRSMVDQACLYMFAQWRNDERWLGKASKLRISKCINTARYRRDDCSIQRKK